MYPLRKLFLPLVVCLVFALLTSFGKRPFAVTRPDSGMASPAPSATFSYKLDGTKITGGEVDALMLNNAVYITKAGDRPDKLVFFLGDQYDESTSLYLHSLRFTIPDKTGTVSFQADNDDWKVEFFVAVNKATQYTLYGNETFNVTVSGISSGRVTGTFSGKVKIIPGTGKGNEEYSITEGKFDLPVRPQH